MSITSQTTRQLLLPRSGAIPALAGHAPTECARLDSWQATVPVLGYLFHTAPAADRGLLLELNRGRQELRPLSLLDVLHVLAQAGGMSAGLSAQISAFVASRSSELPAGG